MSLRGVFAVRLIIAHELTPASRGTVPCGAVFMKPAQESACLVLGAP